MKIGDLAQRCGWKLLAGGDEQDKEVKQGYAGDLLSWVMSRAREYDVWVTVMGNVNAIAVAALTDVSAIVLADNAPLDKDAEDKANAQGVLVYAAEQNIYDTLIQVYECLKS